MMFCICVTIGTCFPVVVTAQEAANLFSQPDFLAGRGLDFGLRKLNLTYVFTGNADVLLPVAGGSFRWINAYQGSIFRTGTTAVRDDQAAQVGYSLELGRHVQALVRGSWVYSADSRNIGLSSMQRLNGVVGLRYTPTQQWSIETLGGLESTTQLGSQATGPIMGLKTELTDFTVDLWGINARLLADWHQLDAQRTNADVDISASVNRTLDDGSSLRLGSRYTALERRYFTTVDGGTSPLAVEGRQERRFLVDADVNYATTKFLSLGLLGHFETNGIGRMYNDAVIDVPLTATDRQLQEIVLDLEGRAEVFTSSARATIGASIYQRSETNTVQPLHDITTQDLENLKQQEYQRDNQTMRSRLFVRGLWNPSSSDTLGLEWTSWLLRYDTPSDQNDDDRDELQAIGTLRYSRRLSSILAVGATLSGQYVHTVFLRSSRSSLNNQANIIRLSPFVYINGGVVTMMPHVEVLANYVVYDFEGEGSAVSSFSFRQISYRDSMTINITQRSRIEAPILIRYFERSTLLWNDFAEIPQAGNMEYLIRILLFSRPNTTWDVGAGIRLYQLEQRSIQSVVGLPSVVGGVRSYAPEVIVRYQASGGSRLELDGWYEFQSPIGTEQREIPNLQLTAYVVL